MSSESMSTPWLDLSNLNSVTARRFAEFCLQDSKEYQDPDDPDQALYQAATRLVIERIEQAVRENK
ncbi:MAG: hypothetical protein R3E95_22870 [Thiolinea sp.]